MAYTPGAVKGLGKHKNYFQLNWQCYCYPMIILLSTHSLDYLFKKS